ncbi:EamA family transporter RarD [Georgenia daeguensis]|uniref:EamA family transporter RarD n=1 Tax=Georgenia daeguensis TaxID=908355 RepID=A0ABP8ENZ3_9MICO
MSTGVLLSALASAMFGGLYFLASRLDPLTGLEVFGWRVVLTAPLVTVLLLLTRQWGTVTAMAARVRARPATAAVLVLAAALLGVQLWLFTWAPAHGHALQVALGYFLMPLVMVVVGVVAFGERLSRARLAAVLFAAAGVAHELVRVGTLSWSTVLVALGYPAYFVLRRRAGTATTGAMWFEFVILLPVALVLVVTGPSLAVVPDLAPLLGLLGVLSSAALVCYVVASQHLSFSLFGLLSYLEPVLLALVSVTLLGQGIAPDEWWTYVPIWVAVLLLALEGAAQGYRLRRLRRPR